MNNIAYPIRKSSFQKSDDLLGHSAQLIELPKVVKNNTTDGVVGLPTTSADGWRNDVQGVSPQAIEDGASEDRSDLSGRSADKVDLSEAPTPLIDGFRLSVRANEVLSPNYERIIREGFALISQRARTSFPKAHRRSPFRMLPVVQKHPPRLVVGVSVVMDGNGIAWIRQHIEPETKRRPPVALDGNTNIFQDQKLYSSARDLHHQQVKFLEEKINEANLWIQSAYSSVGLHEPLTHLSIYSLELAWHRLYPPSQVEGFLREVFKAARLSKGDTKIYMGNGVNCRVRDGFVLSIYRKQENLVRFEGRFNRDFFKKNQDWREVAEQPLPNQVDYLRGLCWEILSELMEPMPSHANLSPADALMQFNQVAKRSANEILRRLITGGGRLVTSARDPQYRSIARLKNDGILDMGLSKGELFLNQVFHPLLEAFSSSGFQDMTFNSNDGRSASADFFTSMDAEERPSLPLNGDSDSELQK